MKKVFSLLFFLIIIFSFSQTVSAQSISSNQCWSEKDCIKYRESQFGLPTTEAKDGFVTTSESLNLCNTDAKGENEFFEGEKYGFCLAASKANTKISIAGRNSFTGIQDFISYIYRYSFVAASIIAIIIVIISGIQWIVSAGNSSTISEAKKRIGGAVIGLILLAFSYTILYTINPYLVNFKPFNIYMVNEEQIHTYCSQITKLNTKLYKDIESKEAVSPTNTDCGTTYYIDKNKTNTCLGDSCPKSGQMCAKADINTSTYSCIDANVTGKIINNSIAYTITELLGKSYFAEGWTWEWVNNPYIYYICNDGSPHSLKTTNRLTKKEGDKTQNYSMSLKTKINSDVCKNEKGLKGFALRFDFDENDDITDEEHFIGIAQCNGANICIGVDLGDETESILEKANKKYFITQKQLEKGLTININVGAVNDVDNDSDLDFYTPLYTN